MTRTTARSIRSKNTGAGARKTCRIGWGTAEMSRPMGGFEFKNAEDLGRKFKAHGIKYLFFGKSGAILLGYSDTTQDVDLYVDKHPDNCERLVAALLELGVGISEKEAEEIRHGKDFIQLRNGPFDLDLIFAPYGIERFDDAWRRHV